MRVVVDISRLDDGGFLAFPSGLDSTIFGEGDTVAEAKADLEDTVKELIAACKENGRKVPDELIGVEFEYRYPKEEPDMAQRAFLEQVALAVDSVSGTR